MQQYCKHEQLREIIYWKTICENIRIPNNNYLVKDYYQFKIEPELKGLFKLCMKNKHFVIAGGYCYKQMFNIPLESSDIDIYILGADTNKKRKQRLKQIHTYLYDNYALCGEMYDDIRYFKLEGCNRIINIIITTTHTSVFDILSSFSFSNTRCAMYMDHTYTTYDCIYTLKTKVVYNTNIYTDNQLFKVNKKGLKLYRPINHNVNITNNIPEMKFRKFDVKDKYTYDYSDSSPEYVNINGRPINKYNILDIIDNVQIKKLTRLKTGRLYFYVVDDTYHPMLNCERECELKFNTTVIEDVIKYISLVSDIIIKKYDYINKKVETHIQFFDDDLKRTYTFNFCILKKPKQDSYYLDIKIE
jgi:hypothetical protein